MSSYILLQVWEAHLDTHLQIGIVDLTQCWSNSNVKEPLTIPHTSKEPWTMSVSALIKVCLRFILNLPLQCIDEVQDALAALGNAPGLRVEFIAKLSSRFLTHFQLRHAVALAHSTSVALIARNLLPNSVQLAGLKYAMISGSSMLFRTRTVMWNPKKKSLKIPKVIHGSAYMPLHTIYSTGHYPK